MTIGKLSTWHTGYIWGVFILLMTVEIKDMPGQYLNLGQILPKKLIQMYLTYTMIKTKKTHVVYLRGKRS